MHPEDAIETLPADHRHIEALWNQAQAMAQPGADALDEILRELSIHTGIEKQLLYPVVRSRVVGGTPIADRAGGLAGGLMHRAKDALTGRASHPE